MKVKGTVKRPRLCVFKSLNHIYAQLVDDENNKILAAVNDLKLIKEKKTKMAKFATAIPAKGLGTGKVDIAYRVGKLIAEEAQKIKIEKVVFDRGGFVFHGKIKALAQGARDGGLKF